MSEMFFKNMSGVCSVSPRRDNAHPISHLISFLHPSLLQLFRHDILFLSSKRFISSLLASIENLKCFFSKLDIEKCSGPDSDWEHVLIHSACLFALLKQLN